VLLRKINTKIRQKGLEEKLKNLTARLARNPDLVRTHA